MQRQKKQNFCKEKSRVKLAVYDASNTLKTYFSFPKDDAKGYEHTMKAMQERILEDYYKNNYRNAIFYNTYSDSILLRVTPSRLMEKRGYKVKLLVFDGNNNRHVYFPNEHENCQSPDFAMGSMTSRILQERLDYNFNAAIFYDKDNKEIARAKGVKKAATPAYAGMYQ